MQFSLLSSTTRMAEFLLCLFCIIIIANLCLFSIFKLSKRLIALYLPCWSVGWLVGRSVDVTINSFNIYRHKSPLLTQYHSIPISTNQYQVILTQYHLVTTSITPYWPSTIKYQPVLPCKGPVLSYIMMSIATVSIDHNSNKRFALFTWSSFKIAFLHSIDVWLLLPPIDARIVLRIQ